MRNGTIFRHKSIHICNVFLCGFSCCCGVFKLRGARRKFVKLIGGSSRRRICSKGLYCQAQFRLWNIQKHVRLQFFDRGKITTWAYTSMFLGFVAVLCLCSLNSFARRVCLRVYTNLVVDAKIIVVGDRGCCHDVDGILTTYSVFTYFLVLCACCMTAG